MYGALTPLRQWAISKQMLILRTLESLLFERLGIVGETIDEVKRHYAEKTKLT